MGGRIQSEKRGPYVLNWGGHMFAGDIAGAREQWRRVFPVIDAMVALSFSQAVKAGLRLRGEPVGSPREPLPDLPPEGVSRLENALA